MNEKLIKTYLESGIITMGDVMEAGKDIMNVTLEKVHPYAITYHEKQNRYETYVRTENGRKKVARKSREDLVEALLEFYNAEPTFETVYDEFIKNADVSGGTLEEYAKAYRKFYQGEEITQRPLEEITQAEMKHWLIKNITENDLTRSGYEKMKVVFSKVYRYANSEKGIRNNPFDRIHIGSVSKHLRVSKPNKTAFSISEAGAITELCKRRRNIYDFLFPFVFQTGVRRGEAIVLKWSDIEGNTMTVQRKECKYQESDGRTLGKTVTKIVERTKGKQGWREVRLTPEAMSILEELKEWQAARNLESEFIFFSEYGRASIDGIEGALQSVCKEVGMQMKSMHKMRKTYISVLLDAGVAPDRVRESVGHVDITTTMRSYWKDVKEEEESYKLACEALQFS